MPLYEYECASCEHRFEIIQRYSDPPAEKCPICGGPVRKLLSSPAIQFKGSGWYVTDYARKGSEAKETADRAKTGESSASSPSASPSSPASGSSASTSTTGGSSDKA
jgi:putative FmdB family regulatory protein